MFYRYEAYSECNGEWVGIAQAISPDHRRKMARFLVSPKWYEQNPEADSVAWFTEFGYQKYHERIEEIIADFSEWYHPLKTRLTKADHLDGIVMNGKVQVICQKKTKNQTRGGE